MNAGARTRSGAALIAGLLLLFALGVSAAAPVAPAAPAASDLQAMHSTSHHGRCARRPRLHAHRARRCRPKARKKTSAPAAPVAAFVTPTATPAPAVQDAAPSLIAAPAPIVISSPPATSEAVPEAPATEPPSIPHVQVGAVEYSLSLSRTSVPAGKVVLEFVNDGQDEHNLHGESAEGPLAESIGSTPSKGISDLHLEMRPGSYTLFCSLPTHEARGMKATLTVE